MVKPAVLILDGRGGIGHLPVHEIADIGAEARHPQRAAVAGGVVDPFAGEAPAVGIGHRAGAAAPVTGEPADIHAAVGIAHDAVAVPQVLQEGALVDAAVGVGQLAVAMEQTVVEITLIPGAVGGGEDPLTLDDAVGEVYDKVARLCSIPYPGGILLDKMAGDGNPNAFESGGQLHVNTNADLSNPRGDGTTFYHEYGHNTISTGQKEVYFRSGYRISVFCQEPVVIIFVIVVYLICVFIIIKDGIGFLIIEI